MRPGVKKKLFSININYITLITWWFIWWLHLIEDNNAAVQPTPCDKSRKVFNTSWGVITDGPSGSNYTQDSHCEWLIKANNSRQFITLTFRAMGTECSYDYVFVYDGDSFKAPLLGSFSGKTEPQQVTAASGAMLILLYSDTNYVLDGFRAEFFVTDCPNNCSSHGISHGMCTDHFCVCDEGWGGKDCSRKLCPENCGNGTCASGSKCVCEPGFSGQACTLHRSDTVGNKWHWLSHSETGLSPRAAHSAVYLSDSDSLFVFGGYDLNRVLGDLVIYRFNTSHWEDEEGNILDKDPATPLDNPKQFLNALLEHVGDKRWGIGTKTSFFSNILLAIADNSTQSIRYQRASDKPSFVRASNHARHLRIRRQLSEGSIDEPLERHKVVGEWESQLWEQNKPESTTEREFVSAVPESPNFTDNQQGMDRKGSVDNPEVHPKIPSKPAPRYGHAACSYNGGFVLYGGKLSNGSLSDELWFYNTSGRVWTLRASKSEIRPPPLTRHTLTRAGREDWLYLFGGSTLGGEFSSRLFRIRLNLRNYLIVFGGYSHRHNKEEICYDNQMYLYHLGCHTWISHDILGSSDKGQDYRYPKQQGVFAHAADVRNGNTLLIVGGYHGNVNSDLLAYTLPPMLASRTGEIYEPEQICNRHRTLMECTANPECGWCSADEVCYGRTVGINCTTNLQTTRCPGVCPALGDCHSCLIHGNAVHSRGVLTGKSRSGASGLVASVASKLRLDHCTWCVQNARCNYKDDNFGVCGLREDSLSQVPGWWGPKGTEVVKVEECRVLDRRPGLTFIKYRHPANFSQPDSVSIINATTVDFNMLSQASRTEQSLGGEIIARLLGFLRPPDTWSDGNERLRMCASFSSTILRLSHGKTHSDMETVANLTAESSQCVAAQWPNGQPVVLQPDEVLNIPGRYLVDFESHTASNFNVHQQSKMELQHNKSHENAKVFTFEYLEPFENGSCHMYSNCLHCLTDSMCGWCSVNNKCLPRSLNETEYCVSPTNVDEWHYLTLLPSNCANCSNYISCESCVGSNLCEWWTEDARCARRGRFSDAVVDLGQCPTPCHKRTNCSQCLDEGRCVWCEATQECFSFSVYTSEYQFGLCREWVDQVYSTGYPSSSSYQQRTGGGIKPAIGNDNEQCKSCSRHTNCSSCLHTLSCGWCYDTNNPITGVCVQGDFNKPLIDACSQAINDVHNTSLDEQDASWSYAECPDVDECSLNLDNCHKFADCTNTRGSFKWTWCFSNCVNGYCMGKPHFSCKCDLGWTGEDCSISCGCNNHSTCKEKVGVCDLCHDWTEGQFCERCKNGSFGNATTSQGCHACNCNGHGDASRGICDPHTGVCFCQDNTEGDNCERCKKGYYGDPRHGGMCFYQCMSRGMLYGTDSQGLGSRLGERTPWEMRPASPPTKECLWIVKPNGSQNKSLNSDGSSSIIQFTIHDDINVSCQENSVYVYDGLPEFVSSNTGHQSHVLGIFCSMDTNYPVTVEAKSGTLTVYYKQGDFAEGFNASYSVLTCKDKCYGNHVCHNVTKQCVCKEGYTGANCSTLMCPNNCSAERKQGVCDKVYGRCLCTADFGGNDCSVTLKESQLVFTRLFDSNMLADSLEHLRKTLPRFGHSLVLDKRGSLWMFGGFSLSHGPLNDIRLFDTKNNTWMPVTVDSTRDTNMPQGRYFHAAEFISSRQELYVYGGLTEKAASIVGLGSNTLNDFWKFDLKNQRWTDIPYIHRKKKEAPPLAGHTLTLCRLQESETLVLIGGFSPKYGFLDTVWEFDLKTGEWDTLNITGSGPLGVYGHSTVYHSPSKSFYVFGGYLYGINRTFISNKLYAFHYPTRTWTLLPGFEEYNPYDEHLPRARFLHSAISTDDFMLIFGGRSYPQNTTDSLVAYTYTCNQWIRLISRDIDIVGTPPPHTFSQAMTFEVDSDKPYIKAYIIGGFDGSIQNHVTRITLPRDLCALWTDKDKCRNFLGCSFCGVFYDQNTNVTNSTYCYSNNRPSFERCENQDGTIESNNGVTCDASWLANRRCEQFLTCTECLSQWPGQLLLQPPACKWCTGCSKGHCASLYGDCDNELKCTRDRAYANITVSNQCPERQCAASDCEKCSDTGTCAWTRQALRTDHGLQVTGESVFDWDCASLEYNDRTDVDFKIIPPPVCPSRCSEHTSCDSCLASEGAEGGWHECRWSVKLNECLSPSYQPLYCSGGVCGLVLRRDNIGRCPEPCSTFRQCSTCLRHAHCGWCSVESGNNTGYGFCTEGSDEPNRGTCDSLFSKQHELLIFGTIRSESVIFTNTSASSENWSSGHDDFGFSYHYFKCPPENECLNNHHTCDVKSEQCVDQEEEYLCQCGQGYRSEKGMCVPVCSQGCVRGICIEPDMCKCDFGYVGANCSIQCQCNGHSDCEGPDKLTVCLSCQNNTQGPRCERCKPMFVGDPSNGEECVPCIEYCHGHTSICVNDSISPTSAEISKNAFQLEGPTSRARCLSCGNLTSGDRCEGCILGHFRINQDKRTPCRPCECHGHGDTCDPDTGEGCDCKNNTESDPSCNSHNNKGLSQCWMHQCSKCKDSYMGTPTNGHQCYRQMIVDSKFCFDAKQLEECKIKPKPLYPGQSVFFVIQPRFMNVDIRVIVDVTQGSLDLFLSPLEDTFVVTTNASTGAHMVEVDRRYQRRSTATTTYEGEYRVNLSVLELVSSDSDYSSVNGTSVTDHYYRQTYVMRETQAHPLTTFVSVHDKNMFVIVRNLQDRLVLTIPQDKHDLGATKFFIALTATGISNDENSHFPSYGMIFFRQDQLHIDLFVFFSVFFSCFFLFLAACVVAWKAKQAADVRRARRRHVVEMLHMAKRPFATVTLLLDPPSENDDALMFLPASSSQSPHRKKQRKHVQSVGEIRPVAVEPTDDGVAAVGTVFVRLPGGSEAPVHLALASSLILLARVYPNSRAFLRRRSSHAPS
ncbi:Laminin subunit alpha [Gryllus bimaculatus]|nr:Laminin subunit alpha [Gryllus bimaculatus]